MIAARSAAPALLFALIVQAAIAVSALLTSGVVDAHEFSLETRVIAFVKIEPREAHFVVRVPLHLLRSAKFPTTGSEINLAAADAAIERALELLSSEITIRENGRPLAPIRATGRLTLPSDRSFENYDKAVALVAEPLAPGTRIYADQGFLDAHFTAAIVDPGSRFTIQTKVAPEFRDYLKLAVRYIPLDEPARAMVITSRSGVVALNPTWYVAAGSFVVLGIAHILTGYDHLLFLLCLIIPLHGWRQILAIVTTFTVAHSFTLLGSALSLAPSGAWFPPFIETAIAASIVYMALENIVGVELNRRVLITCIFGLVHGFGFSYGLQENLQFAGTHLIVSLLGFNIGIEIGQIVVLAVMLPVLAVVRRFVLPGRIGLIILSAIIAHTGWHWMTDRAEVLLKVEWPQVSIAGLAILALWIAGVAFAAGAISVVARRMRLLPAEATAALPQGDLGD